VPKVEIGGGGGGGEWWDRIRRRSSYTGFQCCIVWMDGNGDKKEKENLKLEMWEDWKTIFCVEKNKMNSLIQTFWIMPWYWIKIFLNYALVLN